MSLLRRGDESSLEDERDALRRQRAEGAAELERLKQVLAERVEFVRLRERELDQLIDKASGGDKARFRLPESKRDDPALTEERQALAARTTELGRREAALQAREAALAERERAAAAAPAGPTSDEELTEREAALAERETELEVRFAELERRDAELRAQDPAEREARIDARLAELREAELQFVKTQAELAARSDSLAEHEQELAARERALGGTNGGAPQPSPVDIEAIEERLLRLEQSTTRRGTSFSAGVRAMQQRGARPRKEPDAPLH
jgi:hypothetical protein